MSEEFEKWFTEKDGTSIDTLYSLEYYLSGVRDAFAAGQAAERDAIAQYIVDQGTIEVTQYGIENEQVYYITDDDIEAIRKRGEVTSDQ